MVLAAIEKCIIKVESALFGEDHWIFFCFCPTHLAIREPDLAASCLRHNPEQQSNIFPFLRAGLCSIVVVRCCEGGDPRPPGPPSIICFSSYRLSPPFFSSPSSSSFQTGFFFSQERAKGKRFPHADGGKCSLIFFWSLSQQRLNW